MNEVSKNLKRKIHTYGEGHDKNLLTDTIINDPILDEEKKFKILEKSSLFIMTSDTEGSPFTVIEALSVGVPVILRDTFPNAKNLVVNNYNGLIFNATTSPKDVALKIGKLLENRELLIQMSKNSFDFFNKNFTVKQFSNSWKSIINNVIVE